MRTRLLINLLLLVVVIGLGALFYSKSRQEEPKPEAISHLNTRAVQRITVERPDKPTIELEKKDGDWKLLEPLQTDAEDNRISSILMLPESASESRYSASDQNLEKFGLKPARLTLTFDGESFIVGDENPLNPEQRYVLYNDEVHLISGRLYQRLSAPLTYYVNPDLTPPDSEITRIRLPHGVISKQGEDWRIIPSRLSDSPDTIVAAWQKARASYVKQHDAAESEYAPSITLEFAKHDAITYHVLEESSQIILARPDEGLQYHLGPNLVDQLLINEPESDGETSAE